MDEQPKYDPLECLAEEVRRFKDTNMFTPLLVTNFYAQAACVVTELKEARKELVNLRDSAKRHNLEVRRLEKIIDAYEEKWVDEHI